MNAYLSSPVFYGEVPSETMAEGASLRAGQRTYPLSLSRCCATSTSPVKYGGG
jgi:hypothetical protein